MGLMGHASFVTALVVASACIPGNVLGFTLPAAAGLRVGGGSLMGDISMRPIVGGWRVPLPLRMAQPDRTDPTNDVAWNKYIKQNMEAPAPPARQPEGPLEDDPSLPMVEDLIVCADERKGERIWAARVAHLTYTTSFFVNVEGTSRPMLQAIASNIEEMMKEKYSREIKWQGNPDSGWILLDYGDVICNILTSAAREYYDLESLWKNGEKIPMDHLINPSFASSQTATSFEDDDWGTPDPFAKWNDWDETKDLSPAEREMLKDD